jgi:hypothetical protein
MADESDEPKNFYEGLSLNKALQEEILQAKERANNPPPPEEWTHEDQARLDSELARIQFDPTHDDPDFAKRSVQIHGEDVPVHAFNRFPVILSIADTIRGGGELPEERTPEGQYVSVAEERKYPEIAARLQSANPAAYKRSLQIFRSWRQDKDIGISQAEQEYILSQTYAAAARIAQSLDPEYPLDYLRR